MRLPAGSFDFKLYRTQTVRAFSSTSDCKEHFGTSMDQDKFLVAKNGFEAVGVHEHDARNLLVHAVVAFLLGLPWFLSSKYLELNSIQSQGLRGSLFSHFFNSVISQRVEWQLTTFGKPQWSSSGAMMSFRLRIAVLSLNAWCVTGRRRSWG